MANIAQIYGFEQGPAEAGHYVRALVMEPVEGPTLADRTAEGSIVRPGDPSNGSVDKRAGVWAFGCVL